MVVVFSKLLMFITRASTVAEWQIDDKADQKHLAEGMRYRLKALLSPALNPPEMDGLDGARLLDYNKTKA